MRSQTLSLTNFGAALGAALALALPLGASAQQYGDQPSYAQPPPASPSYANQQKITGTISGFDGQWIVYMHDQKGYTDHVTLHQGTIINPTGIKLLEGMKVTVYGYADGPTFQADRIDVAYSPYSPYYGSDGNPAYGYGYGGYGTATATVATAVRLPWLWLWVRLTLRHRHRLRLGLGLGLGLARLLGLPGYLGRLPYHGGYLLRRLSVPLLSAPAVSRRLPRPATERPWSVGACPCTAAQRVRSAARAARFTAAAETPTRRLSSHLNPEGSLPQRAFCY